MSKNKTHKERIAEFIYLDENLLAQLFEPGPNEFRTGPSTPAFAEKKQKSIIYLTGANLILLDKIMSLANKGIKTERKGKETKSSILNRIIENCFKNNPEAFMPKKDK